MTKEIKNGADTDGTHQELLDSNIQENWFARVGVHKPYTVFVCIMAILILGVFAFTSLSTELFPKMNLPYAIVVLSPDQDRLTTKYEYTKVFTEVIGGTPVTGVGTEPLLPQHDVRWAEMYQDTYTANVAIWSTLTDPQRAALVINGKIDPDDEDDVALWANLTNEQRAALVFGNNQAEVGQWVAAWYAVKLAQIAPVSKTAQLSTDMQSALATVSGVKEIQSQSMSGVSIIIMEYESGATVDTTELVLAINNSNLLNNSSGTYGKDAESDFVITYTNSIMHIDPSMMPVYTFTATGKTEDWYKKTLVPRLKQTTGVADVSSKLDSQTSTDRAWLNNGENGALKETISFTIQRSTNTPTTDTVKNIIATLDGLKGDGFEYVEVLNQGEYINSSLGSVGQNLIIGALLAVVILFLFLRSVKMTLAIAISIPVAVIATFVAMYFAGIGLNIVSMSALALAVGMLVDNSVVVLENIFRLRKKGEGIKESAIRGASQIMGAMIASTLTTICVFFPMFFLTGLIMEVFMDLVWVIIFALACSLLVAVMFLPGIISSFKIDRKVKNVKAENANADGVEFETVKGVNAESDDMMEGTQNINAGGIKTNKEPNKFSAGISKFFTGVKNVFDKCLNFSISRKWGAVGLAFALFIGSAALLFINGWTLMPATDEGEFTQTISFKSGANFDKEEIPGLAADIYAVIKNSLGDDLDTCLVEYTAGGNMMSMMSGGSGGESMGISITLKDSRKIETEVAAQNVNKALKDVIVLTQNTNKYYYGKLDEEVTYSASTMTSGLVAESITVILTSDEENPVKANEKLGNLQSKMLAALGADKIEGVYSVRSGYSATTITQVDKRVTTTFEIKINDNAKISDVQSRVDAVVAKLLDENDANYDHIFDGIQTANDGFAEQMNETYTSLGLAIVVGLILVYLVMVMVFQSFVMPLIVLICIPLAFTGSFMALAICGMPLSVPSLIGFMILMGIIVNNGILAVDYTNQCRRNRLKVKEALVSAIHTRMRPIFMTALTTIIGLVPMAFNWSIFGESMGGAMMQPLAVVAIGGLLFGTLTTLLVVPAFYAIFIKDKPEELGVEIESDLLNGGDGNDGEIDDEENGEFVRIRGKKVSKAKRQQSQHINENAVLLDNK